MVSYSSIIYSSYLLFCSISIQMCVQELLGLNISRNMRYDIVSTYDTLIFSLFINYLPYKHFVGLVYMILAMILAL
jgi:hypothetical protein